MKTKTKTYLLLTAVLGIWGTIAYKIINGINPEPPEIVAQNFDVAFNPKKQADRDTFSIKPVDRDPFLGTLTAKKRVSKQTKNAANSEPYIAMPTITYGGLIQKQNSGVKVFVVNINSQQYLLKQGQTVDNVKLVRGDKQSIVVRFNGKNKTIKL